MEHRAHFLILYYPPLTPPRRGWRRAGCDESLLSSDGEAKGGWFGGDTSLLMVVKLLRMVRLAKLLRLMRLGR